MHIIAKIKNKTSRTSFKRLFIFVPEIQIQPVPSATTYKIIDATLPRVESSEKLMLKSPKTQITPLHISETNAQSPTIHRREYLLLLFFAIIKTPLQIIIYLICAFSNQNNIRCRQNQCKKRKIRGQKRNGNMPCNKPKNRAEHQAPN